MDWSNLAPTIVRLGAPILGATLGGPLGATVGKIIADAFGVSDPTPAAVGAAIDRAEPAAAAAAARAAEERWLAALADIGKAQVAEVGATQRAEIASQDRLQRWWRPLYALELSIVECPAFAATLLHALWLGHEPGINGFASLSGLLIAYFGARLGVLGVYVSGRSREKQAQKAAGVSSVAGEIVNALTRRKR